LRSARLSDWQDHYNHFRPHGSLDGLTPWEKWQGLAKVTPCWDEVEANYNPAEERIRHADYWIDLQLLAAEAKQGKQLLYQCLRQRTAGKSYPHR